MASVFLNYRREDSSGYTGRIYDRLVARFGKPQIFRDIDRIEPGLDFSQVIDDSLGSCVALLVLIGPKWLESKSAEGELRLHQTVDYVRFEIEKALDRGIRVIPVLVPGVRAVPAQDELPESIRELSKRHAFRLTEESWDAELNRLIELLEKLGLQPLPPSPSPKPKPKRGIVTNVLMGLGALTLVGVILSALNLGLDDPPEPPQPPNNIESELPRTAETIAEIQRHLTTIGLYGGSVDGIAGPQTDNALRAYQRSIGQTADGRLTLTLMGQLRQGAFEQAKPTSAIPTSASLNGTWYDNYANRYEIRQNGTQVTATAYTATNDYVGEFQGTLDGNRVSYGYQTIAGTSGSGVGTLQPDKRHLDTLATDFGSAQTESNQLHLEHLPGSGGF